MSTLAKASRIAIAKSVRMAPLLAYVADECVHSAKLMTRGREFVQA